jgi:predicted N-acetyltransferase YhbS
MNIRPFTPADLPAALALCAGAGWNQTEVDLRRMLVLGPDGAFAAWEDGRVVGTTMTIAYGTALAWIGVVLVDPDYRRRGIALALMQAACDHLQRCGVTTIKLDATPDGRLVYQKLGFVDECLFQRWRLDTPQPPSAADVSHGNWNDIAALDTAAFGVDRSALVQAIITDAGPPLVQRDKHDTVTGYVSFRPGARASYVGPVVAEDHLTARSLLTAALSARSTCSATSVSSGIATFSACVSAPTLRYPTPPAFSPSPAPKWANC